MWDGGCSPQRTLGEENMADSEAIIGQTTFIRGNVRGDGDLNVAGRVEGTIEVGGEVVFEETAIIQSEVSAKQIVVRGALAGDLHASGSIVLEAGARVVGDIDAPSIRIDEGALYRGKIEMGGGKPATRTASQVTQARPAPKPVARPATRPATPPKVSRPEPKAEVEEMGEPAAPPPPAAPKPPPRPRPKPAETTALANTGSPPSESEDQPPPPVVPALKKKSKGAVRKRTAGS